MKTKFNIGFERKSGKLHVHPRGDFDGNSAWELIHMLDRAYTGERQVIIDTGCLREVYPFGCSTFQMLFDLSGIPRDRLLLTGGKGSAIAPEGCRIMAAGQRHNGHCSGSCADCHCRRRRKPS